MPLGSVMVSHRSAILWAALWPAAVALAQQGAPGLVLPPSAAAPIAQAFARMEPTLRTEQVEILRDHVDARVCAAAGNTTACFTVRLDAPRADCPGRTSGPFCLTFPEGPPAAAALATIEQALDPVDGSVIWASPSAGSNAGPAVSRSEPPTAEAEPDRWPATLTTSVALVAVPIGLGALVGWVIRRVLRRRLGGFVAAIACVGVPAAGAFGLVTHFPVIGLWDAGIEGLLFGLGALWSAHRALAESRNLLLLAGSLSVSLLGLELGARLTLPPPPAFPTRGGPHLLLAEALRGDLTHQPWDTLSKEIVCSIVYGDQYPGVFAPGAVRRDDIVTPGEFTPRQDARRRVLHLGDSMAFGFGLTRDETFTAGLERLEPGVQHINAAIPGTAPDAYFAVLLQWIAAQPIDLVVMHIYEGNDLDGLDSRHPCCDWQSLLAYGAAGAAMRCSTPTAPDLGRAGFTWLRYHNPPPYLVRALVGTSSAAAYLGAAMTLDPYLLVDQPMSTRLKHLELILGSARDALAARHIPFVVDVLPTRSWLEDQKTWQHYGPAILEVARLVDVPALDPSVPLRDAVVHGQRLFFDNGDIHFNAAGHRVLATWLHDRLAAWH